MPDDRILPSPLGCMADADGVHNPTSAHKTMRRTVDPHQADRKTALNMRPKPFFRSRLVVMQNITKF
jgi:hypothetical protein